MLVSMVQNMMLSAPRATLNLLALSAAAALILALSLVQLTWAVISLAQRGMVPGGFWTFLATFVLLVCFTALMTRAGNKLAQDLTEMDVPDAPWAAAQVQIVSAMTYVIVFALLLFVQSFVLFAITIGLAIAFWQALVPSTATARRHAQAELALQHHVAAQAASLGGAGASAQAWREEVLEWVRRDMRQDLVTAGKHAVAAEQTAWRMTLWSRLRWYAVLFSALFVLPVFSSTPPASLTLVAFVMLFLDRIGVLLLNIARESELWATNGQESGA